MGSMAEELPRTLYELVRQRALFDPNIPLVAYPDKTNDFVHYTAKDLDIYSDRLANFYAESIPPRRKSSDPTKVVGLLAASSFDFLLSAVALSKMGFTVMFLSTRLSDSAYVNLLNTTSCFDVVVDSAFIKRVSDLKTEIPELNGYVIANSNSYLTGVAPDRFDERMDQDLDLDTETKNACWIIHSSGSTGPPKAVRQPHCSLLRNYADNFGMTAFITVPLFHTLGLSSVFRGVISKKEVYIYNASLPLTGPRLVKILKKYEFQIFICVPYTIKLVAETGPEGVDLLSRREMVLYGGSSCPDALGEELVRKGVRLTCHYGCTECGQLMSSLRPADDTDWDYMRVPPKIAPYLRFEQQGTTGLFELVVLPGWPPKVASNRPDGSYATKDLFTKHPSKPNLWKVAGRLDDTLVLLNGEKAIPLQMEQSVRTSPYVTDAVVFGSGKPMLGMFVIPSEAAQHLKPEDILDRIELEVRKGNAVLPAYAGVSRDMIRVLPFGMEYPKTDKGTVIRAAFYLHFAQIIEQVYTDVDLVATSTSGKSMEMTRREIETFLHKTFTELLSLRGNDHDKLGIDTDLFGLGLDSLQAIRARAQIVKHVAAHGHTVSQNIVFEYPSISTLAGYLSSLGTSPDTNGGARETSESGSMRLLVEKYSVFKAHVPVENSERRQGTCIIVTGATGSLGAHVVSQLVKQTDVRKIYCLVRASSIDSAGARVIESLTSRKTYELLSPFQRNKICALPSSFNEENLGLEQDVYTCLLEEVDTVIHLAWAVNFNLGLSSLESHIAGTHNLIQFCLSARSVQPARFFFGSSVSVVINTPAPASIPERIPDPTSKDTFSNAQFSGYGQSKLVAELICSNAAKLGMVCRVLRIGQIIGDLDNGIWNPNEAIPMIIQSAITVKALPKLDERLSWLPVDLVAGTIVDLTMKLSRDADVARDALFHVVHPTTVQWHRDLLPALRAAGLEFDELSPREWVKKLRADLDPVTNPPIKLLEYFAAKYDHERDTAANQLYFSTDFACSLSQTLHSAPQLSYSLVAKMVKYWQTQCWKISSNT